MLSVGSLFSGIGGFDLGLELAGGFTTAWFCEQDEFCQHVLAEHWPGVPCYPDITELRGADVEPIDVLCGGFPCQDISLAGTGAGLAGARSGLWSEYARLIGELGPRYVVVENVSALLARGLGTVLGDLAALGYDAEWDCIPASAVGAPHRRDRVWLVAYPNGEGESGSAGDAQPGRGLVVQGRGAAGGHAVGDADGVAGSSGSAREGRPAAMVQPGAVERTVGSGGGRRGADERRALHDALRGRHGTPQGQVRAGRDGAVDAGWWGVEPDVGRVADGVPARVDRLRSLGNALVPQIATWIGSRVMAYETTRASALPSTQREEPS